MESSCPDRQGSSAPKRAWMTANRANLQLDRASIRGLVRPEVVKRRSYGLGAANHGVDTSAAVHPCAYSFVFLKLSDLGSDDDRGTS